MLALVTDSTCGLTRDEAAELRVDVLPMSYAAAAIRHAEGFVGGERRLRLRALRGKPPR